MKTRLIAYLLAFLTVLSLAVDVGADTVVNVTTRGDLEHAVQTGELEGYDVYRRGITACLLPEVRTKVSMPTVTRFCIITFHRSMLTVR